ncbi:TonB-dependent receptor [Paraferrimonas sedimenticola]|uniref:TonB-dependent receptor n=1 Tax=Paraferrimonas sedimenticola TaxID=375674 RepID=A0AA37RYG0_9GAMM|nr:TonB-dependent receptor [Paraferrimonas sedimenticola]GLP97653.1 TonB-dependent receptor [Paraferrimonas sedimenticola]
MFPKCRVALAIAAVVASTSTFAQDDKEKDIERIEVSASRMGKPVSSIPNLVTVIDQEQLQQQLSVTNDLSTILGNLAPGFSPSRQKMSSTGETLRGRKPLILIDGVPQSNPLRDGGRSGKTIDPAMIERIEIIHGANAMHGMGAQGGIINYITKKADGETRHSITVDASAPTSGGSDGVSFGTTYSFAAAGESTDVIGSISYRNEGMYYDANGNPIGMDTTQGDTADSQSANGFIKLGKDFDNSRLQVMASRYQIENNGNWTSVKGDKENDIPTGAEKKKQPWVPANNKVTTVSVDYTHNDIAGQQMHLQAFSQNFEGTFGGGCFESFYNPEWEGSDQVTPCGTGSNGETLYYEQSVNHSNKLGLKASFINDNLMDSGVKLAYGMDIFRDTTKQDLLTTGYQWVPESTYDNIAPYAQADYQLIDGMTLTAGVRHEAARLTVGDYRTLWGSGNVAVKGGTPEFSETLGNAGISYQINNQWRVYTSFSQGFGMPDIGRVLRDGNNFIDNPQVDGNVTLQPIVTDNYDLGFDYSGENFVVKAAYFQSYSKFGARLQRNDDGIYEVKREANQIRGIEASGTWYIGSNDDVGFNLATTQGMYDSNNDGKLDTDLDGSNIAPDRINLFWAHNFENEMSLRWQANFFLSRDFKNNEGQVTSKFDGYNTLDVSLAIPLKVGQLSLGIQNLTNTDYYTYYSQTVGNDSRYFKGRGRYASISYRVDF